MGKFKVGDRVVYDRYPKNSSSAGTVVKVREYDYVVKFDKPNEDLHDGDMGDGLRQYWFCVENDLSPLVKQNLDDTTPITPKSLPTGFSFTLDIDNRMEMGEYYITNELGTYKVTVDKVE